MPELPEVETVARGLAKRVIGDVIESIWLGSKKEPLKSPAKLIARTLENARIASVRRVGKQIVFDLLRPGGSSSQWIVHLGMTGQMLVCQPDAEIKKHTHAIAKLASGREIRFLDPRRFGRLSIASNGDFSATGLEPLEISLASFIALFRGRKTPIKSALLNQKLLGGVGNIYADESLFRAGIRPRRRAGTLTRDEFGRLHTSLKKVLREAIRLGGSSISDYVDADGAEGFFQLRHRVYGRQGEACYACKTPIKRVVIAGRSSHYCPRCQK
ncbi:MAG TPA: bifunctional DNA-formamidopyrimidine glycosylase/DNA-(apurinic or apyrimidinic site) lyase [Terriglobales bacterium]|nr:bifunctional DNA-formamidopyrimidine glycosylase/DNA-(apurinic or apyrimidinic site) lyase [Terriglobales bacterium]